MEAKHYVDLSNLKAQLHPTTGLVLSDRVFEAMLNVDRAFFVPPELREFAYSDHPLPIGCGATISAPHMHATALELLKDSLIPGATVLDVGCGSGYLLACMAHMVQPGGRVFGIEHVPELGAQGSENIARWLQSNSASANAIFVTVGDGYAGLPGD